jgi:hypothetical protein
MTNTRKSSPVHVVLVLGTPNIFKARRNNPGVFTPDSLIRTPGTREFCPSGFVGRRDVEAYPANADGDKAWAAHCSAIFGSADMQATNEAFKLADLIDSTGGTLTVVKSIDWDEHKPSMGVYCKVPARDVWAQLAELADETVTA